MTDYKREIDGDELFRRIAGHSYYLGDDILTRICLMQEGKLPKKKDIEPADVVKVVRCGDCEHWRGPNQICRGIGVDFDANGFCPYGERRTEE